MLKRKEEDHCFYLEEEERAVGGVKWQLCVPGQQLVLTLRRQESEAEVCEDEAPQLTFAKGGP